MNRDWIILVLNKCDVSIVQQYPAACIVVTGNIQNNQYLAGVDLVLRELKLIQYGGPSLRKEIQICLLKILK